MKTYIFTKIEKSPFDQADREYKYSTTANNIAQAIENLFRTYGFKFTKQELEEAIVNGK